MFKLKKLISFFFFILKDFFKEIHFYFFPNVNSNSINYFEKLNKISIETNFDLKIKTDLFKNYKILNFLNYGSSIFSLHLTEELKSKKIFYLKKYEKSILIENDISNLVNLECRLLNSFNFWPFPKLHCLCENKINYYVIFEKTEGISLNKILKVYNKGLDEDIVKFIAGQLILIIQFLHDCDIIFRCVNLNCILIDQYGYIKIIDVSQFYKLNIEENYSTELNTNLNFLCPEYILTGKYTKRSDFWVLGIIIYQLTTGKLPFLSKRGVLCSLIKILNKKSTYSFKMSISLNNILNGLLVVNPKYRLNFLSLITHRWLRKIDFFKLLNKSENQPKSFKAVFKTAKNFLFDN